MNALAMNLRYATVAMVMLGCGWMSPMFGQSLSEALAQLEAPRYQTEIFLPYQAPQERKDMIVLHMNSLEAGLTTGEVTSLMGAPDEIIALFAAGDRTEELQGFQYVYLLERSRANDWGRAYDERYIHVNFNLGGQLVSAEGYSMPAFKEVIRELGLGFEFSMGLHETVKINGLLIRLDFIHGADAQSGAESATGKSDDAAEAIFAVSMPDRADNLKLNMGGESQGSQQTITYGSFRLTLLGIPGTDRVSLIVE